MTETAATRSRTMARIRAKNTGLEWLFRRNLWAEQLRGYRLHLSSLPGSPDIAFTKRKVAVFLDGCFWHGCPRCYHAPKNNAEYWKAKVDRNRRHDATVNAALTSSGWTVLRLWEHDIRERSDDCIRLVEEASATKKPSRSRP
ncbi:MAG: very short patch repair endonuclease [Sulfobacillus sp.]